MKNILGWHFPESDNTLAKKVKEFPNTNYQQEAINAALSHVKNFNLAVDVGANVGLHSVRFANLFTNVISLEPCINNFECLIENTKSFSNIEIIRKGLGSTPSIVNLFIPAENSNCGLYSIVDFNNHEGNLISEQIELITLDSLNLSPDLVKIDTQSFELEVLKGSVNTLKKHDPVLILEIEYKKPAQIIKDFLKNFGYELVESARKDKIFVKTKKGK